MWSKDRFEELVKRISKKWTIATANKKKKQIPLADKYVCHACIPWKIDLYKTYLFLLALILVTFNTSEKTLKGCKPIIHIVLYYVPATIVVEALRTDTAVNLALHPTNIRRTLRKSRSITIFVRIWVIFISFRLKVNDWYLCGSLRGILNWKRVIEPG